MPYLEVISSEFLFTSPDRKTNGLKAEYFDNLEWKGKAKEQVDKQIDHQIKKQVKDQLVKWIPTC